MLVNFDIYWLIECSESIKNYRDNIVAHTDKREFEDWFSELDLDECIDCIEKLTKKYYAIFHGIQHPGFLIEIRKTWKEIFKKPWIQS